LGLCQHGYAGVAQMVESQPGQRTLEAIHIRFAFLVQARIGWLLELSTLWAFHGVG
jgi:hypothetical protein